jgi:ATP-dependent Lon protease
LPALNRRDLEDIPPLASAGIRFEFVENVDEALEHALEPEPNERSRSDRAEIQPSA